LALSFVESFLPSPFLPGAKLGLANIVTVTAIYTLPRTRDAALVVFVRVLIGGIFAGGASIFYSACGAGLSFFATVLLKNTHVFSVVAVSAAGGFFHNFGQLLSASVIISSTSLISLLPVLGLMGLAAGLAVGFASEELLKKIRRKDIFNFCAEFIPNVVK
jgi:heptaprenyl diphosphate synthase